MVQLYWNTFRRMYEIKGQVYEITQRVKLSQSKVMAMTEFEGHRVSTYNLKSSNNIATKFQRHRLGSWHSIDIILLKPLLDR